MDMSVAFQQLNWLAILAAALSCFLIGGIWYSPLLFQNAWMRTNRFTEENLKERNLPLVFGLSFLFSFIMAFNLAMFIGPNGDIAFGIIAGFLTGFGWIFFAIGIISLFEKRSMQYVLINGGYMTVAFTAMGAILGAWK